MKRSYAIVLVGVLALLTLFVVTAGAQDSAPPFLGIGFEAADEGVLITAVVPESSADVAGLEAGDVITALNGEAVTVETLAGAVSALAVGDEITLTVIRDDATMEITATLAERPAPVMPERQRERDRDRQRDRDRDREQVMPFFQPQERAFLGVSLSEADGQVVIAEVVADSPAAEAGLLAGDVLVNINNISMNSAQRAVSLIGLLGPGDTITIAIERDGEPLEIEATLGATEAPAAGGWMPFTTPVDIVVYNASDDAWHVMALAEDSPLAQAGLLAGDTITAVTINGEAVAGSALADALADAEAEAVLSVEREGETLEITTTAAALESLTQISFSGRMGRGFGFDPRGMLMGGPRLGIAYTMLDEDSGLDVTEGALVTQVIPESAAAAAGLQVDDVIVAVDGQAVNADNDLRALILAREPGAVVALDVLRDGESLTLEAELHQGGMRFEGLPFDFDGTMPRFFFGPDSRFRFEVPPVVPEPVLPAT